MPVANSCSQSDVSSAISSATAGQTVYIPACPSGVAWTTGISISGKGIKIQGAGGGRIIATSASVVTIASGAQTFTVTLNPFTNITPVAGQTLRIFQMPNDLITNKRGNFVQGTVTSYSAGTLVMNITSTGGSCGTNDCKNWLIATVPQTVIINNTTTGPIFDVTEDTTNNIEFTGIKFNQGSATCFACADIRITWASGGKQVLIHDNWFEAGGGASQVYDNSGRAVVWNNSFDSSPFQQGGTLNSAVTNTLASTQANTSWTTTSTWGTLDTNGVTNEYVEQNDFHAYLVAGGTDDGGRQVWRYNLMNEAEWANHGADSSNYGARTLEFYNNTAYFDTRPGVTLNIANGWVLERGGSMLMFNNTLPNINSQDTGQKGNVLFGIFNLSDNTGPNPCWGANAGGGGIDYYAPRQFGQGRITGLGVDGKGASTDSITYVGDLEPVYIFNNNGGIGAPITNISLSGGGGAGGGCTNPDSASNYIVQNRDYYLDNNACTTSACASGVGVGSGANPTGTCTKGVSYWRTDTNTLWKCTATNTWTSFYQPYTYPHPLAVTNYALSVTKAGSGSGTVTSDVGNINCGSTCTSILPNATNVTLTAAAAGGSTFVSWSGGGCSGSASTCVVPMSQIQNVTANFNLNIAPVITFSTNFNSIVPGNSATLSWTVTGSATSCNINGTDITSTCASGTMSVSPASTTTYTLSATNSNGTSTAQVSVGVTGTPSKHPYKYFQHR